MILASQTAEGFSAVTLGGCGFYPCVGARNDALAARVTELFANQLPLTCWRLRIIERDDGIRLDPAAA